MSSVQTATPSDPNVARINFLKQQIKMKNRRTVNYNLKQGNKVVYKGITNDLEKRAQEHRAGGKEFSTIEKVGRVKTEQGARKVEAQQLATYRNNHGGTNPKYNKTKNG